jgi:CRISPR/Cas system CSM-associated protein Csm5 (group 7 of RAMP superfamily)
VLSPGGSGYLNNTTEIKFDTKEEWKNLQNILKAAAT